ncbi:MAG: hypothetical protein CME66_00160 [Halobacteriovoraceae bacterium]|nr:hypothetical protein [Halobacteriovoraceae bacterium]
MTLSLKNNVIIDDLSNSKSQDEHLVIYKDDFTDQAWYSNGYLEAAISLVNGILSKDSSQLVASDTKIFPILYLFIHSIELDLKIYIRKLMDHYKRGSCQDIPKPSDEIDKILTTHNIKLLFTELKNMIDNDNLHGNREILELEPLIDSITDFGLDAESLRYFESKSGDQHIILEKQRWVNLSNLKKVFVTANNILWRGIDNQRFYFCESNEFKSSMKKELEYIEAMLKEIRDNFEPKHYNVTNELGALDFDKYQSTLKDRIAFDHKLSEYLKNNFEGEKIYLISKGIRFGKSSAIQVNNVGWYKAAWSEEDCVRHFLEDYGVIDFALEDIRKHIEYVSEGIKVRVK